METSPPPSPWDRLVADVRGAGEWSAALIRDGLAPSLRRLWTWAASEEGDLWSAALVRRWRPALWIVLGAAPALVPDRDGEPWVRASVIVVALLWAVLDLRCHGLPAWLLTELRAQPAAWLGLLREASQEIAVLWHGLRGTPPATGVRTRIEPCTRCESWAVHRCWAAPERRTPAVCLDCREHAQAALERAQAGEGRDDADR